MPMKLPTLKVQQKIAIPFTLVFVVAMFVAAFVSISLSSWTLELRARNLADHVSDVLSQTGFALNASVIEKLKIIVGAEIVTYKRNGDVTVSTLSGPASAELLANIQSPQVTERIFDQGEQLVIRDIQYQGTPYKIAYRPLRSPPNTLVALVFPTGDIAAGTRRIAHTIGVITVLMVVIMLLLSQMIARSITSPVHRLVAFTKRMVAGDLTQKARVESGDEIGTLAVAFNDMVDRLRASEEELLRSEKLVLTGQLAARVAHDIRNPLSSIKMQAQLLRTKLQPGEANQESLQAILREIDRLERVVEGLLDVVRPAELRLERCDVHTVLDEALRSTEAQLKHRKIAIRREFDHGAPAAMLDPHRINNAVLNLIWNAADAMPGGGTLVAATRTKGDRSAVHIEICDDGGGIAPGVHDRLFDPFFTTKRDGVGLGLVNTRSIVERHGGTIELLPAIGRGTRAVITLPAASDSDGGAA